MNILSLLKEDHVKIKALLKGLKSSKRKEKFEALHSLVHAHSKAEEVALYEPLKASQKKGREMALEGYEEHHVVSSLLKEMSSLSPKDERWSAKLAVVDEALNHHIEEEQGETFSIARKAFDAKTLAQMGELFLRKKSASVEKRTELPVLNPNLLAGKNLVVLDRVTPH